MSLSLSSFSSSPSFLGEHDQHPPLNLQLLLAVVRGEVQGEDGEDYTKKEGMIRSSNDGVHCKQTNRHFYSFVFFVFFFSYSSIKSSAFPNLTD